MFSGTMSVVALLFSIASFAYVNYDRRVKLLLRPRKGDWCVLDRATNGRETIFRGIIEVYNQSSRPNAIRGYHFWRTWKARWSKLANKGLLSRLMSVRQVNCSM